MKNHLCALAKTRLLWADWQLLTFDAPELACAIRPGQFAFARDISTLDPYLRRTLWFYEMNDSRVSFLVRASDPLAQSARVGETLDVLAPLGRAVTFEPSAKRILLLAQGLRTTLLVAIAHEQVKLGREVVLSTNEKSFPSHLLAPEIELRYDETFDTELIVWADAIIASGTDDFYRDLGHAIRAARYRVEAGFARVVLDLPMPCGTGICFACAVDTSRGVKLACVDGPALDLLLWEKRI